MKILLTFLMAVLLVACVRTPTQMTEVVDDRPGLSFEAAADNAQLYQVTVDGLSYGQVGDFLANENALKLVPGTHLVELRSDGEIVFSKKVYLGAGSSRTLKVGSHD